MKTTIVIVGLVCSWLGAMAVAPMATAADTPAPVSAASAIAAGRAALLANDPQSALGYFRTSLAMIPADDNGTRLVALQGLGRAAYWLEQYALAEQSYRAALPLAATDDDRRAITVLLARTLTVRGRPREAYSLVAPLRPSSRQIELEMARASLALGWNARAAAALDGYGASASSTDWVDRELALLAQETSVRQRRTFTPAFEFTHDSDGLRSQAWSVDAGIPLAWASASTSPPSSAEITAGTRVIWLDDNVANVRLNEVDVSYQDRYGDNTAARLSLGGGEHPAHSYTTGNFSLSYRPSDDWGMQIVADRSPVRTLAALDDGIMLKGLTLDADVVLYRSMTLAGAVYYQSFSDGNDRRGAVLRVISAAYPLFSSGRTMYLQWAGRVFRNDDPAATGYFNPDTFSEQGVKLILIQRFSPAWVLRAEVGAGKQTISGSDATTASGELRLNGVLYRAVRAEISAGYGDSAAFSSSGAGYCSSFFRASMVLPW